MCLHAENSFSVVNEILVPFKLPFFYFDDIRSKNVYQSMLHAQFHNRTANLTKGFDLSGLFEETDHRKEARFTSRQSASIIISKLEDIAKRLRLKVKKDGGVMKLEGPRDGKKGVIAIDAEIFEITPSFHLVEMKKADGDTLEYQKIWKQDIRPALEDIVWAWQGEKMQQD